MEIDAKLAECGWVVQSQKNINLGAGQGVAVREFTLREPHGRADYLLFIDRKPVGAIEAKPKGDDAHRGGTADGQVRRRPP